MERPAGRPIALSLNHVVQLLFQGYTPSGASPSGPACRGASIIRRLPEHTGSSLSVHDEWYCT
jgi:hypothetical protein